MLVTPCWDITWWRFREFQFCWKLDRECHVDFCMFLTPHELNFELLMKTKKKGKWKWMRESCLVYCYSGIKSLFEVFLLYTFYTSSNSTYTGKWSLIGVLITPYAWTRSGDETKITSTRDSQVSVILVGVIIICFRLVSDKKLDKALLSGLSFKTLQLRSPKTVMGLFVVSALM